MNPNRPDRRAERAETERLLDAARAGASATPDAAPEEGRASSPAVPDAAAAQVRASTPADPDVHVVDPLARLLAAAAGPARPGELAGEEAALAAFRADRANQAPTVAGRPHRRRLTTSAVAWMGALAATATAGAAFAAVTLDRAPDPVPVTPSSNPSPTPSDVETAPSGDRTASPGRSTPPTPSATSTPSAIGTPSPADQLRGLCRAWQAKKPEQRDRALRTQAFQELVTAAGGAGEVEAYCQRLVPEAKPSTSAKAKSSTSAKAKSSTSAKAKSSTSAKVRSFTSAKAKPSHPAIGRPAPE
ncbi:hypothetical protein GA0070607_5650 [Micromonospora coriariae]|uniref:Uncharacterized protein n=1 Tax=Micromonospora coriariae TaxID=285665 RepID=A0A1C4XRL1_9ACTN|nr:hypothetical protein [Micromonospora coriariae]SCF11002.1 hypothetical protein GA0070607_5650 [Micromonospora coriariae]